MYETAAKEIAELIAKGKTYQVKVASADLGNSRLYWKPETGRFAFVPAPDADIEEQRRCRMELYKCGSLPFTDFDVNANEETGWVLLRCPARDKPIEQLRKYAAYSLNTPAKLSVAGALLAGTGVAGLSLFRNYISSKPLTRNLGKNTLIGMGLGLLPGVASGVVNSRRTRPLNADGTYGPAEVDIWQAMTSSPRDLAKQSPYYRSQKMINQAYRRAQQVKMSSFGGSPLIHVDSFNRAIWDDTKNGLIRPTNALAVSSTLEASRSPLGAVAAPGGIINTLVGAGVGYGTASVVGNTLGALGLMSSAGQAKLRDVGIWGGMINTLGNSILH